MDPQEKSTVAFFTLFSKGGGVGCEEPPPLRGDNSPFLTWKQYELRHEIWKKTTSTKETDQNCQSSITQVLLGECTEAITHFLLCAVSSWHAE